MFTFYEFFCGGGMVRAGLDQQWRCVFANDFDRKKAETYRMNWGFEAFREGDINGVEVSELPGRADLAWASFPCQDLSLAGGGAGLKGERSGTFWPFWKRMAELQKQMRAPRLIALENVPSTLTSHGGKDFAAICKALQSKGYRFGAMVIDAKHFVPQSRPRLFIIAVAEDVELPAELLGEGPGTKWHTKSLLKAHQGLPAGLKKSWIWWRLPVPRRRTKRFSSLIEDNPKSVSWHSAAETRKLLRMMSPVNLAKVEKAKKCRRKVVGTLYRRTRVENGEKVQRAEVRFDEVAGCLRTPAGGSSRQLILVVDGDTVRSRLLSSLEAARLMGLNKDYQLPLKYNEAYHLAGDGVVVDVVRYLAKELFQPVLAAQEPARMEAA